MLESSLGSSPTFFAWVVLPLLIFVARTLDMTLSTLRIVFIAQGRTRLAPFIGFFEALLWLLVVGQALKHLSNPLCVVAYAGGFAAGSSAGLYLERRLAMGMRILRIISREDAGELVEVLRRADFGVTVVDGEGARGPVKILFTLLRRRDLERALEIVRAHDPLAFFSVEDVRQAAAGVFPLTRRGPRALAPLRWQALRKSK